jgi:F-type H+-transporting ATPase subunit b
VGHAGTHATIGDLLWPVLNFAVFVAILIRFLRDPIREYFRDRTERLREALDAGARARRAADTLRADLERALAELPALRERLKSELRATARQECEQLLESGRAAAARIRADAGLVAGQEAAAAREALRTEVIEEAVREAGNLVRAALRPADHQRLLRDFVQGGAVSA